MIIKNPQDGNVQLYFPVERNKIKDVDFVHIPGNATVEIDDEIWAKILSTKTTVQGLIKTVSEVESENPILMDKKQIRITEFEQTGETREVNLVREMLKNGRLVIVQDVVMSIEDQKAFLNKEGISVKDMTDEKVAELYNRIK
jgi:hypothetical protein